MSMNLSSVFTYGIYAKVLFPVQMLGTYICANVHEKHTSLLLAINLPKLDWFEYVFTDLTRTNTRTLKLGVVDSLNR